MAIYNFKTSEDNEPGSGVYKVGEGNRVVIRQSDYPTCNLSTMTVNNFFKRTKLLASDRASTYNSDYTNITNTYYGGSTELSYQFVNGEGIVTVTETPRKAYIERWNGGTEYADQTTTSGYTHEIFMSREPIR